MRRLTNSMMSTAKTCLKKYWYYYVQGIQIIREADPLWIGRLVHQAIEMQGVPAKPLYPKWCQTTDDIYHWDCRYELAAAVATDYLDYYQEDDLLYISKEEEFEVPLVNPATNRPSRNWLAGGRVDALVRLEDGRLALKEIKTTSYDISPDSDYWRFLGMDQQISHYLLHTKAETVIYDVIQKPGIRPKLIPELDENGLKISVDEHGNRRYKKNGEPYQSGSLKKRKETPEEYGQRCRECMSAESYIRKEIPRLENDLKEYQHELWAQAKLLTECYRHGYWFKNTNSCNSMHRTCEFLDLCFYGWQEGDPLPVGFEFS